MKFAKLAAVAVAATVLPFASAHFNSAMAQTIKIGFITSFTGQNASVGVMMDKTVKLWMKEHEKDLPAGVKVESAEIVVQAKQTVEVDAQKARQNLRLIELLEDLDDVSRVTANFDIPEEVFAEVAG